MSIVHPRRHFIVAACAIVGLLLISGLVVSVTYTLHLRPRTPQSFSQEVVVPVGSSTKQIAASLEAKGVIRSAWSFEWYVSLRHASQFLQAGTYTVSASQGVPEIAALLTHGKVATQLVTILPGQRLDQVRRSFAEQGFTAEEIDAALEPRQYSDLRLMSIKPPEASLEGLLYPDSFQRTTNTTLTNIVRQSLTEMQNRMTADRQAQFAKQGLSPYQAIILASVVEKEAVTAEDRRLVAQVFLSRLALQMSLGSDVTAFYGSQLAGQGNNVGYDTPYNTRLHAGLPPTPIGSVSLTSLDAVAQPATTNWLYFVAGDDGTVHFSHTLQEHEALTKKYCTIQCQ